MSRALVVTASYDKQVRFWDAASGRTVRHFTFQDSQVNALLLIPEVQCLAVAGFGVIRLYNLAPNASAVSNGGAAVPQGVNQAPSLISSYESQGSMNFTSMGYFPITRRNGAEGNFESMGTLADSVLGLWRLPVELIGNTVVFPETSAKEYSLVLYATSEDGHIRFFDAQSPTTLRLLKDIAIGVALTCSALSPDRRYLLTGSQIGQVAVWHLPSIVASMESEAKNIGGNAVMGTNNNNNTGNNAAGVRRGSLVSANMQHPQQQPAESEGRRRLREHFGSHPLQEISFDTNYPAIRSIAIEPLGRWSAIATNAGKLHFLRFSHDGRLGGSKALRPTFVAATTTTTIPAGAASGAVTNNSTATTPQASTTTNNHRHHHHHQQQQSGQAEAGNAALANAEARPSRSSSEQDLPLLGISPDQSAPGPKESIYRSALVVNEINSELVSQAALQSGSGAGAAAHTAPNSTPTSSMGAALLSNLSHVQNSMNEGEQTPERQPTTQLRGGSDDARTLATSAGDDGARTPNKAADKKNIDGEKNNNNNTSPIVDVAAELQEELEMEVFHTFHAHYKYILKVAISPNGELLATCSADYTVGRFLVPQLLRSPPEGLGSTLTHVPTTNLGAGVIGGYHDDTTSLASTQTPHAQLTAGTTRSNSSPAFAPTAAPATIVPPLSSEQTGAAAGANGMPESGPLETRQDNANNTTNNNENRAALTISAPAPVTSGPNDTTPTTTSTTAHSVDHDNAVDYTTTTPQLPSQPQPLLQPLRRASTTQAAHTNDTSNSGNAGTTNGGGDKDEVEVSSSYTSSTANSPGMDGRPVHSSMVYFKPLSPLTGHNRWVWDCVFSDCCRYLFTASSDNHVRMWNRLLTDRPQSTSFVGHTKPVVAILIYYERRAAPIATET